MCLGLTTFVACNQETTDDKKMEQQTTDVANPLLVESSLFLQAPEFDKIKNSHFKPAFEQGMAMQLAEIDSIVNNSAEPTFENTVVALEESGSLLSRVSRVFFPLTSANTNDSLQAINQELAPKLAAQRDAIYLNTALYERIKAVADKNEELDAESKRLLEYYLEEFEEAGAMLSSEDKERLKKLNEEEAGLRAKFSTQLLAAGKAGAYVTDNKDDLAGLSEGELKTAAEAAEADNQAGKWLIPLHNTTQQPILISIDNRETRKTIFENSVSRAEKGDENDTRDVIKRIAEIRAEKAQILGFESYAAWSVQNQMAKTPEAVRSFLAKLIPSTLSNVGNEAADLQKMMTEENSDLKLEAHDWSYYAEKLRLARYDLDENQIKPYFELWNTLENGVFFSATKLFGITFKQRNDLPLYHEDMRVYEVLDHDGSTIGLFYCDFFKRPNKRGGAWMGSFVGQSKLRGTKPVIYNVCNYTKPAEGEPALLSFDDVTTLFHEFGHGLHGLFADQMYGSLSGTSVARDFVEFPSQFNEHWALFPEVFKNYATHYETGELMPQELVDKIKKASTFNQGFQLAEILAAATLDFEWHSIKADQEITSIDAFEADALKRNKLNISQVPPRYRTNYFAHIWGGGYGAGYYAYLWAEMLDSDGFKWFESNGGLTRENGQKYRETVLSRGNTLDYNEMFNNLTGRDPQIEPMLKNRGLK